MATEFLATLYLYSGDTLAMIISATNSDEVLRYAEVYDEVRVRQLGKPGLRLKKTHGAVTPESDAPNGIEPKFDWRKGRNHLQGHPTDADCQEDRALELSFGLGDSAILASPVEDAIISKPDFYDGWSGTKKRSYN